MPEKNTITIELSDIKENPLNLRSMEPDQIAVLANNIADNGLLQPLAVYRDEDGMYMLISGHRRLAAMKLCGMKEAPCKIIEKPADEFEEQELLTSANISRKKVDEVIGELNKADQTWRTMPPERKLQITETLKSRFLTEHQSNPKFIENPDTFVSNNFRPALEYIRSITGYDYSNTTIKNALKKAVDDEERSLYDGVSEYEEDEEEASETKEKKEKVITIKDIAKASSSLRGMIMGFTIDDPLVMDQLHIVEDDINDLLNLIVED